MPGRLPAVVGENPAVAAGRLDDRPGSTAAQPGGVSDAPLAQGLYGHLRTQAVIAARPKELAFCQRLAHTLVGWLAHPSGNMGKTGRLGHRPTKVSASQRRSMRAALSWGP